MKDNQRYPEKIGELDGEDVYICSDGDIAIERDHMYLCGMTEEEFKRWEDRMKEEV